MPRIPTYQPGQVGPVQITDARLRPADSGAADMIGRGMQQLGRAGAEFAQVQDRIAAQNDDTQARKAALEFAGKATALRATFGSLQGANAREAQAATEKQLSALRDQTLGTAANPRMRQLMEERVGSLYIDAANSIAGHAIQQQQVERKGVLSGAIGLAQDEAAGVYGDAAKFPEAVGKVRAAAQEYAEFAGMGDGAGSYIKEQVGGVYANAVLNALTAEDVPMAEAIFDAHKDEMTFAQRNQAFASLQKPLLERDSALAFREVTSGAAPVSGKPADVAPGTYQSPVAGGRVSSKFGEARGGERHSGLDIAAPMGAAIHPIAGGVVEEVTQDDRAGRWVKVRHPDGTTSTYAHMGNQSVKQGDPVSPSTVLGTVGMTGRTSGPHVHLVVRDAAGERVDPEKVIGGRAAGGQVIGATSAARNWDQASVLSAIDKREDWSFEKRERVKAYARQQMAKDESALSDRYQDAADRAAIYIGKNPGLTSVDQLPADIRNSMNPRDLLALGERLKSAAEAGVKPNGPEAQRLNQLRILKPDEFAQLNLSDALGKVSMAELDTLRQQQAEMRVKSKNVWSPSSGITSALSYGKNISGLKLKPEEEAAVVQTMEIEATRLHAAGKTDDQIDYNGLFRRATRHVATVGMFGGDGSKPVYQMGVGTIPDAWRKNAEATFQRERGRKPSEEELLGLFRATYRFREPQ